MAEKFDNIENVENEDNFLVDLFDDEGNKQTFEHLDTVRTKVWRPMLRIHSPEETTA